MKKLFILFLMGVTTFLYAQTISPKKCNTCGNPLVQCQYKGRHPKPTTGSHSGHDWVDLGLPSGTKWATMNVGASSPCDYGDYYAWGETRPKSTYTYENLKYCQDSLGLKFSKYVILSEYGIVDGKKELDTSDDAAYVNWGSGWRMPSKDQLDELYEKCKWTWTMIRGHNGYKVVGPNGNFIFLPAAGYRHGDKLLKSGAFGYFWSRSLYRSTRADLKDAYKVRFFSGVDDLYLLNRFPGRSVRPVTE